MGKPSIADSGWTEMTVDYLRAALKAAEGTATDMANLRLCDAAGCGRIFDGTDPRSLSITEGSTRYDFCPACEMEAQSAAGHPLPHASGDER